ncbi:uncharacterized protein [Dysidea avara]|uniref:uncharacterized protein n=1 Tax=Dysidea avara TaxID=196820 RepID=UPI00331B9D26
MTLRHSQTVFGHSHTLLLLLTTITILHTSWTTSATLYTSTNGGIHHNQSELLYLSIGRIDFNLVSPISGRAIVNTSWLHDNYTDITSDVVKINNSTINFTYSYSNNLDVEGDFFNISMLFWRRSSSWSMVLLQHQCYNDDDYEVNGTCTGFIFRYPVEVRAPMKSGYYCSSIPEISNNTDSRLVITEMYVQAFDVDVTNPPKRFVNCDSPKKDEEDRTGLIFGCVAAGAVIIAAVIVLATYLYRRRRHGQYNLLD